jgi:glycosyltransferase involved in cell wall biosynthesis
MRGGPTLIARAIRETPFVRPRRGGLILILMASEPSTVRGVLSVGVLVDLAPTPESGGHVKVWQRLAEAATARAGALDLTIHFLGEKDDERAIADNVRFRTHRPVFSTARLSFLPYVPAHTDLWPYHRRLAEALVGHDVLHTTNGCFAFARTAERVAERRNLPLVNSVHTDTAGYAEVFTAQLLERLAGGGPRAKRLLERWHLEARVGRFLRRRLHAHQQRCAFVLASRPSDADALGRVLPPERVGLLRRGLEHERFHPRLRDRLWLEHSHGVPPDRVAVLFVGRLDRTKHVAMLVEALRAVVDEGLPVQLVTAGIGPERALADERLAGRCTHLGLLEQGELARVYASADLLAFPSRLDETSNVVLEALASGLPAVVAEPNARLVGDGQSGLVVRGGGIDSWVSALRALITDEPRRQRLSRAAREHAERSVPTWTAVLDGDLLPAWSRARRPRS